MSTTTASPTTGARAIDASILATLNLIDPVSAEEALHEMFMSYVRQIVTEPPSEEMHDDVCTLYLTIRNILKEKKFAGLKKAG